MRLPFFLLTLLAAGCQTRPAQENAAATPGADLRETRWLLRRLAGRPIVVPANTTAPFLLLRTTGAAEGNGSCNSFRGDFFAEKPGELKFSPLMSTRMACPAIETESEFMRLLAETNGYRISGDTLRLLSTKNALLLRLEAAR